MAKKEQKRSPLRGAPLLLGAIGFGALAALLAFTYLKSREASLIERLRGEEVAEVQVVVASQDLPRGSMITKENFAVRRVPTKYVHDDAVLPGDFENFIGRAITADVGRGKPLLRSFMDRKFPVDFSDLIEPGRRAMTIQVDEVNSIAGFIRPGNDIDLFVNIPFRTTGFDSRIITAGVIDELPASVREMLPEALVQALESGGAVDPETVDQLMQSSAPKDVILPVLQRVRVLATGRDPYRENLDALRYPQQRSERNFSTITVDVAPAQAALLAAAEDKGDLLALLRNRDDASLADFSTRAAADLFDNAVTMAEQAREDRQRLAAAEGVDAYGNLVDAEGRTLATEEQLVAAGYTLNERGEVVDSSGNVVDPASLVVAADGRVLNREALAAQGYTVNAAGQIVDSAGNVVASDELVVTADGRVLDRGRLAAAGLSVNERGEVVDARGRVVASDDLVTTADGNVVTRQQLEDAGLSVDATGRIVDAAGNEVTNLAAASGGKLLQGADGRIFDAEQLAAAGLSVDGEGRLVDAAGRVIDPNTLVRTGDGRLVTREQLAAVGLRVAEDGSIVDATGNVIDPSAIRVNDDGSFTVPAGTLRRTIRLIVGGDSTDGIAKQTELVPPE